MQSPNHPHYEDGFEVDTNDAPGGVIVRFADGNEEIIHANQRALSIFECQTGAELLDLTQGTFRNLVHEDDLDVVEDSIWGQVRQRAGFDHVYYRARTKTGRAITISEHGRLAPESRYERPVFFTLISEVTPQANVDWLTGLPGMTRFHELARIGSQAMLSRGEQPVALALDLMGMKNFNSRYGRNEGDRLLRAFADVLRRHFGIEASSRFAEDHFSHTPPRLI